jgi:hypothetical protein
MQEKVYTDKEGKIVLKTLNNLSNVIPKVSEDVLECFLQNSFPSYLKSDVLIEIKVFLKGVIDFYIDEIKINERCNNLLPERPTLQILKELKYAIDKCDDNKPKFSAKEIAETVCND